MPKLAQKKPLKFVGFRLPEDLYDELLELAEQDSRSVTSALQALVRKAVKEDKAAKRQTEQVAS